MSGPEGSCAHCGSALGVGRFCTNCGASVGSTPQPAQPAPRAYDEEPYEDPEYDELTYAETEPRGLPVAWLWVAAAVVLLVVVLVVGWSMLLRSSSSDGGSAGPATPVLPKHRHTAHSTRPSPTRTPTSPAASPSPSTTPVPSHPLDVAALARAFAPAAAPAAVDFDGTPVTYVASNMVDGSPTTCWRVPGNATGTELTFRLAQATRLTRVGIVNGYAKTAHSGTQSFDWYLGNRRVIAVQWVFDDGTTASQLLRQTRRLQPIPVGPVTTRTVRLRITAVSPPGTGPAGRDDTAVSEVSLVGTPIAD